MRIAVLAVEAVIARMRAEDAAKPQAVVVRSRREVVRIARHLIRHLRKGSPRFVGPRYRTRGGDRPRPGAGQSRQGWRRGTREGYTAHNRPHPSGLNRAQRRSRGL